MKDFLELVSIDVQPGETGQLDFVGTFDGPRGLQRLPLPSEAMLSYSGFSRAVLTGLGLIWVHSLADGMPAESADKVHRTWISQFVNAYWRRVGQGVSTVQ